MLRICSRALVKVGMVKPWHLVKPASATLVSSRNLTQQEGLLNMPVPPLKQTFELYLQYLEPLVEVDELERTHEQVEEFLKPGGVGERLQQSLKWKERNTDNWFIDHYMKIDHLNKRKPLVSFSNAAGIFPRMDFRDKMGQIRGAAKMVASVLELKANIDNKTLPVDNYRGKPLCMRQYEQVFSSCRIPGLKTDSFEFYDRKHITVAHNNQFFVLEVHHSNGIPLSEDQLSVQLEKICNASLETDTEPVGLLTTTHRDIWSKTYINLMKDKTNKESVEAIQSSIMTLCLDGTMSPAPDKMHRTSAYYNKVHGGGSQWNSGNRWFDKGVQVIIAEDGTCGANGSNAIADGTILMAAGDYLVAASKKPQVVQSFTEPLPEPQKLHFNLTPELKKDIEEAKQQMDMLAQDLDLHFLRFEHFGKNAIKAQSISPDAFLQMGLQLANYRMNSLVCPTLESVSLRRFKRGRISLILSNSPASAAFVKAFDDPEKQNSEKVDLLEKAVESHALYTNMGREGQDIYCHIWGLKMQADEENIPLPDLFTDTAFHKAFDYKLSASQVINTPNCQTCFGPEETGIFDLVYCLMNDHMEIMIATLKANSGKEDNSVRMARYVEDALLDMRALLEQTTRAKANLKQ